MKDHAFARHDANWHRDWDKRRTHFNRGRVFVFIDGFWWGLYPWDYYPYGASDYYPNDYYDYDFTPTATTTSRAMLIRISTEAVRP